MILFVIDGSDTGYVSKIDLPDDKKTILVLNKMDLGQCCTADINADETVSISAKEKTNIDILLKTIHQVLGINYVDLSAAACFTSRQHNILHQLIDSPDKHTAKTAISELLTGPLSV